jgi:AraC-like DNA-binding protein
MVGALEERIGRMEAVVFAHKPQPTNTLPPQYEYKKLFPDLNVITDPAHVLLLHLMYESRTIKVDHNLLARKAGCYIVRAKSEIKARTGKTLRVIQKDFVLEQFKKLLLASSDKISAIDDFGYNDQQYLTNIFRRQYGVSPGKYRKENAKRKPGICKTTKTNHRNHT